MAGSVVFDFTNPDEFQAGFLGAKVDLAVAGPGCFRAQLVRIELRPLQVVSCREELPRIAHLSLRPQIAGIAFPTQECENAAFDGARIRLGDIMFLRPGKRFHARTPAAFSWACILFNMENLARASRRIDEQPPPQAPSWCVATPPKATVRRLLRLHRQATEAAVREPGLIADAGVSRELEDDLVGTIRECLAIQVRQQANPAPSGHSDALNCVEDLVQANLDRPLGASDFSTCAGVPVRTLGLWSHQHLGMSPSQYHRLRRLNRARSELLHADPEQSFVRDIAARFGFTEPGRFAVQYQDTFGESPSATLRGVPSH